jgi:hypothetical protein
MGDLLASYHHPYVIRKPEKYSRVDAYAGKAALATSMLGLTAA